MIAFCVAVFLAIVIGAVTILMALLMILHPESIEEMAIPCATCLLATISICDSAKALWDCKR